MAMREVKRFNWDKVDYSQELPARRVDSEFGVAAGAANDVDGWQRYRRWVPKAPVPQTRRAGLDASLYTWRGYRRWSDEVRRNWSKDNPDGKDAS